ncbi:hypothetical protein RFI_11085 [Reticulomyxa filosa]|uniref:Uncharacterized protein n=1 Tax=Reticulomyxa filosa TaxID=46433 RepID=X6NJZ9_RETFI|nr:hypothetical protein RFI_11085 [Reticulomyxa filosa]|eukprot:ETO26049.1 hypothetical protein RFI_11085 [Reticulomyxa filosa]
MSQHKELISSEKFQFVVLHGSPGVGKLTVAKELVNQVKGYRLFHNHLLCDTLLAVFDFGSESFVKLREKQWLEIFEELCKLKQNIIFTFAFESTVTSKFIPNLIRLVQEHNGRIIWIELMCEKAALLERVRSDSRQSFKKLTDVKLFEDLLEKEHIFSGHKTLLQLKCEHMFRIDNTNKKPSDTAAEMEKLLDGISQK